MSRDCYQGGILKMNNKVYFKFNRLKGDRKFPIFLNPLIILIFIGLFSCSGEVESERSPDQVAHAKTGYGISASEKFGLGEGDCDNSYECKNYLTCMNSKGQIEEADKGIKAPGHDTCQQTRTERGDGTFGLGQGDCDNSYECKDYLTCMNSQGQIEEADQGIKAPGHDTCQKSNNNNNNNTGNKGAIFGLGKGDCDNSYECKNNLTCMNSKGQVEEADQGIKAPGHDTCQEEGSIDPPQMGDIPRSKRFLIERDGVWYNLICKNGKPYAATDQEMSWIKLTRNNGQKRSFRVEGGSRLYCADGDKAERCVCHSGGAERFHFKKESWYNNKNIGHKETHQLDEGTVGYMSTNSGFQNCLKILDDNYVHAPCNWTDIYSDKGRCKRQDRFTEDEHRQKCAKVSPPWCRDTGENCD